ncbi:MAG: class II fructose-bisphosphate aldolase [Patescibacteria group bacterium]|nr:class II fructose-bisphosphate aldolase [Patescibacteria group bacterium]
MFINVSEELKKARNDSYAIGAFNTNNLEATKAICAAAKETSGSIIIQTTPGAIKYSGLRQIFEIVKTEIEETGISAALHLDHAKDLEIIKECIDIGYRSVMIDGSKLPFAENVALTRKVVDYARPKNVSVEAEIGVIGVDEGGENVGGGNLSSPEEVKRFIELTDIDSVAVSVGNEHGAPEHEKIDLKLLEEISKVVKIPLVMHGASGLSDDDINSVIKLGITKINIDTAIRRAFIEGLSNIPEGTKDYREILKVSMDNIKNVVMGKIKLFYNKD